MQNFNNEQEEGQAQMSAGNGSVEGKGHVGRRIMETSKTFVSQT